MKDFQQVFSSQTNTLRTQIVRRVVILSLIAILAIVVTIAVSLRASLQDTRKQLDEAGLMAARTFDDFLGSMVKDLLATSDALATTNDANDTFRRTLDRQSAIFELAVIDPQGNVLYQRRRVIQVKPTFIEQPWLATVQAGDIYLGQVDYGEFGVPFVNIAVPIKDEVGDFTNTLLAKVDLTTLWETVITLKVGETGYVYITDSKGQVLAYRNLQLVQEGTLLSNEIGYTPQRITETNLNIYSGLSGETVIASAVPLTTAPWFVVIEQPVNEALVFFAWLATALLILLLLVGLLVYNIVLFTRRRIVSPLLVLREGVELLTEGNLNHHIDIPTNDEFGTLANAFNFMTDQLKEIIDTLEQRVADRTHRLEIVALLGERLNKILDVEELLAELVNQVKERFDYYHAHIFLLNAENEQLVLRAGVGEAGQKMKAQGHQIPLRAEVSLIARAARSKEVVRVDDVRQEVGWLAHPLLPKTKAEMAVPITHEGQIVGVLDVQSDQVAGLDEGDANLLRSLANHVAIALTNARLFAQNQIALQEAETLYTISQRVITADNLSKLIAAVVEGLAIPAINRAVLLIFERDTTDEMKEVMVQANWYSGQGAPPTNPGTRYSKEMFATLELLLSPKPVFFENIQEDERTDASTITLTQGLNICAMAALPLWSQGQQLGVLLLQGEEPYAFKDRDIQPYLSLLGQLATSIENQRLFEQMQQAKDAAEFANQAKSEFLSSMSHELRTPLNGILGYAQILKRDKNLTTLQADGLNIIKQSGEHLLTLITDILDLSKIEAGKLEFQPTSVHLSTFLEGVAGMIRLRAQQKEIGFIYEALTQLPVGIETDEKRLRQILINLLGNAIKFTDEGQISFRVSVVDDKKYQTNNNEQMIKVIHFEVADTGVGIKQSQLQKIFQPFEQVGDTERRAEGTGLGLSISRQLVQLMKGTLQVESKPNQGSTFWFEIPLHVVHIDAEAKLKEERTIIGYKGQPQKALVVDDKSYNRSVLTNFLEPLGFEIVIAENGQEAIAQTQAEQPSVIFMDMIMPVMMGFEAVQQIRQLPEFEKLVIFGASASVFEKDREKVRLAGCNAFLPKPINFGNLLELLKTHLKLEWIYDDETVAKAGLEDSATPKAVEQLLLPPPTAELTLLYELAKRGSMRKIRQQANQLAHLNTQYAPFAHKLIELAKGFEGKKILTLIEQYM